MKLLITIILLLSVSPIKACECVEFEHSVTHARQFYNWYDKVFIGNFLENDEGLYKFEVIQGFKNCQFRDTLWGKYNNSCSITPTEKGLWIVYASTQDSTTNEIDIDGCNSTRNLNSDRQYLPDGYDISSEAYHLENQQSNKVVELSILEQLRVEQTVDKKSELDQDHYKTTENEKTDWLSKLAIGLALLAILMNLQLKRKTNG